MTSLLNSWRRALKARVFPIPHGPNYLGILLALMNTEPLNSTKLLDLITESSVRNSKYFKAALRKSALVVLHNFLTKTFVNSYHYPYYMSFDVDDETECFLNRRKTTYSRYCEELIANIGWITRYKPKPDKKKYVKLVNSIFTTLEENELILQEVHHNLLSGHDKYLTTDLIETGHFFPIIHVGLSLFEYALLRDFNIAKYYIDINFFTKRDIYALPWSNVKWQNFEVFPQESRELLAKAKMRQVPTLYCITLVAVSAMIGPLPNRKSLVSKLNIPPTLQRALTYQSAK